MLKTRQLTLKSREIEGTQVSTRKSGVQSPPRGLDRSGLDRSIARTDVDERASVQPAEEHSETRTNRGTHGDYYRAHDANPTHQVLLLTAKECPAVYPYVEGEGTTKAGTREARESPGKPATALDGRRDHTLTSTPTFRLPTGTYLTFHPPNPPMCPFGGRR